MLGAIGWLLTAKKPIVNLRVFANRNFAVGSVMIFCLGAILYSGSVLLPQLAQQRLGYTATLAGLVLSPGGFVILMLIPIIGRVLPYVQTRYLIGFGFFTLGCAYSYAHGVTPDATFGTLALMRATQTLGLAFLFVPTSTISYSTMPRALNGDASSLYVMLRNVAGSIGISLATAGITRAHPDPPVLPRPSTSTRSTRRSTTTSRGPSTTLRGMGRAAGDVTGQAMGMALQALNQQAAVLAYRDVFAYCAVGAVLHRAARLPVRSPHHARRWRRALTHERQPGVEAQGQSVADRARRDPGCVHGDPGHHHRQRRAAAYRRRAVLLQRRGDLDAHLLPGGERHRAADQRASLATGSGASATS